MDMSKFIQAKSDQLNADDLMDSPKTITVTKVSARPDSAEQPVIVNYEGDNGRPFLPCKTARRIMVGIWGADASKYVGRSMTLYRDPDVQFGGMKVGGIRISHMSGIDAEKTVALLVTRGRKAPFKVLPLKDAPAAEPTEPTAPKQTAEQWTDTYIGQIKACSTTDELIALQTRSQKSLAKLETDKPELHELAVSAGVARAGELQGEFAS